jgi:dipeptidase
LFFLYSDTSSDPVTFEGARFCEARVWSFYSSVLGSEFEQEYLSYASGADLTKRMPLFIKPPKKLSLPDIFAAMRDHYEGTALAFDADVGAGGYSSPYRVRPLSECFSLTQAYSFSFRLLSCSLIFLIFPSFSSVGG